MAVAVEIRWIRRLEKKKRKRTGSALDIGVRTVIKGDNHLHIHIDWMVCLTNVFSSFDFSEILDNLCR